jgi:hypothetical protein
MNLLDFPLPVARVIANFLQLASILISLRSDSLHWCTNALLPFRVYFPLAVVIPRPYFIRTISIIALIYHTAPEEIVSMP